MVEPQGAAVLWFTRREREVLFLICQAHCNKEIAHRLDLSVPTVKGHIVNLLRKTRTSDRSARRSRLSLMLWALYHPEAVETGCLIGPQIPSGEQSCQYSPRLPRPIFELPRAA